MKLHLLFLVTILSFSTYSQSTIGNLDFEDGDFTNWTPIHGTVGAPSGHGPLPFVFSGFGILFDSIYAQASHYIIDSQQNDFDISFVKALCPFTGSNSARLGDNNGGLEAPRLEKIFQVGPSDTTLDFFYAYVVNNPSHPLAEQPYFFYQLFDSSGGVLTSIDSLVIDGNSTSLKVDTTQAFGAWQYVDWSHRSINLKPYIGKNVLIRITVGDCGYGGHSARAYIDFSMNPKNVFLSKSLCFSSDSVIFRGKTYTTNGIYSDTVWAGSTIDSVFTLFVREVTQNPILPSLSSKKNCSRGRYDIDCSVSARGMDSTRFDWYVNDSLIQSGIDSNLSYNATSLDTVYCLVTAYSINCKYNEYSDTLFLNPYITAPSVNLILFGSVLRARPSGGQPPYSFRWKVNYSTITHTDSILTALVNGNYYVTIIDANGCESKDSIMGYRSNIEEIDKTLDFNFYPNPATNSIYLELNGEQGTIEIMDVQGKVVQANQIFRDGELKLKNLDKGVYLLRFKTLSDKVITKKLMVD